MKDAYAYVLVLDGLRPDEVTPEVMPNLVSLRDSGTWFPAARSLPVMETIPNHVMMMTGVRPDRSGVPGNQIYDATLAEPAVRTLDQPSDLAFPTLLDRLRTELGLTTASVLSKDYLYGIFDGRADHHWNPAPTIPVSEHTPDARTMSAALDIIEQHDPEFVFVNLGDIDRMGHSDFSGTTLAAGRAAVLAATDTQLGLFLSYLRDAPLIGKPRWDRSMVIVLADHSMDWSYPHRVIAPRNVLQPDWVVADNGGAALLYWTGGGDRSQAVSEARKLLADVDGVLALHEPAELRLGSNAGDLIAFCESGWRFTAPEVYSNPIPGNHAHPATEPIPFIVAGGSPRLRGRHATPEPARTVDVAPTVGAYFGLTPPVGGYDGTTRTAAFR